MENRKIAMDEYEIRQQNIVKKSTKIFYFVLVMNILIAIPTVFEPGKFNLGLGTLIGSVILSVLLFLGVRGITVIWSVFVTIQLLYYFFHIGFYMNKDYPLSWAILICARSLFCLYSGWALLINYDVQDIVKEHHKKLFGKK